VFNTHGLPTTFSRARIRQPWAALVVGAGSRIVATVTGLLHAARMPIAKSARFERSVEDSLPVRQDVRHHVRGEPGRREAPLSRRSKRRKEAARPSLASLVSVAGGRESGSRDDPPFPRLPDR
jgi:hypothetical protein